jgi:hypothetical protein
VCDRHGAAAVSGERPVGESGRKLLARVARRILRAGNLARLVTDVETVYLVTWDLRDPSRLRPRRSHANEDAVAVSPPRTDRPLLGCRPSMPSRLGHHRPSARKRPARRQRRATRARPRWPRHLRLVQARVAGRGRTRQHREGSDPDRLPPRGHASEGAEENSGSKHRENESQCRSWGENRERHESSEEEQLNRHIEANRQEEPRRKPTDNRFHGQPGRSTRRGVPRARSCRRLPTRTKPGALATRRLGALATAAADQLRDTVGL